MPKTFWDYAKDCNKIASLEEVFSDWVNTNKFSFNDAKKEWDTIHTDIRTIFAANIPPTPPTENLPNVEDVNKKDEGETLIKGILLS